MFEAVSEMVQSALDGYHVCLFSYGQTGSGKTHTMNGVPTCDTQRGIIPRAVSKILESEERKRGTGWEYTLQATFIEIYNESLRDLLGEENGRPGKQLEGSCIKHNPRGHTEVCPIAGRSLAVTVVAGIRIMVPSVAGFGSNTDSH